MIYRLSFILELEILLVKKFLKIVCHKMILTVVIMDVRTKRTDYLIENCYTRRKE